MKLSKSSSDFTRRASKVLKKSKKEHHLDWSVAKDVFGSKHKYTRDYFASGWLAGGGTLDHASKKTVKRLKNVPNPSAAAKATAAAKTRAVQRDGTNCQGVTKRVHVRDLIDDYYYDSCDVIDILYWIKSVAKVSGVMVALGVKNKVVGGVSLLVAGACGAVSNQIETARDKSNKSAII